MSFSPTKIPLPIVMFCAGILPFIIMTVLDYFELLNLHGGLGTLFLMTITFTALPICFSIGFFHSFRRTGKLRNIGLTLNGLSLAVLLFWIFSGFK